VVFVESVVLSALSYCKQLTFITSFKGEGVATKIVIDASKLSAVLADDTKADVTVIDVLKAYTPYTLFLNVKIALFFCSVGWRRRELKTAFVRRS
jgi:hypothetical protein